MSESRKVCGVREDGQGRGVPHDVATCRSIHFHQVALTLSLTKPVLAGALLGRL